MPNGIITRGFASPTIITRGYGSFVKRVVEAIRRGIYWGKSGNKDDYHKIGEILITAKLVSVNGEPPLSPLSGTIRLQYDKANKTIALVEHVSTRITRLISDIVIIVKRVKRGM